MSDLDFRPRGSLMRSARTGVGLFGSGLVVGIIVGVIFHALFFTMLIIAAVAIVVVAVARAALGRRRSY